MGTLGDAKKNTLLSAVGWTLCIYAFMVSFENILKVAWGMDTVLKPHRMLALLIGFLIFLAVPINRLRYRANDLRLLWMFGAGLIPTALAWFMHRLEWSYFVLTSIQWLIIVWVFLQARSIAWDQTFIRKLINWFVLGTLCNGVVMLYFFLNKDISRQNGFMDNPNYAAFSLNLALVYFLHYWSGRTVRGWILKFCYPILGILVAIGGIMVSGSRGAFIAGMFTLIFFIFYQFSWKRLIYIALSILLLSCILRWSGIGSQYADVIPLISRVEKLSGRNETRLVLWQKGWQAFQDRYFIGIGIEQFKNPENYNEYIQDVDHPMIAKQQGLVLHNDFLAILFEFGIPAFLFFLAFLIGIFQQLRTIRSIHERSMWMMWYLNIVTFMFFSTTLQSHVVWFAVLLLSMVGSLATHQSPPAEEFSSKSTSNKLYH